MPTQASPSRPSGAPFVLPLYTFTLFLSAFLLFSVQPMFTKMVLPLLGGSAAVWNTAVVFFQATLLLGYFYAHLSTKLLGLRRQTLLHGVVLLVAFLALPIDVADWTPPEGGTQIPWLIGLLTVSIGLPFFAVSATAPLLQKWFAHTDHAKAGDPYFLYGGSNLGSLAALLSYPLLVEPALGLSRQGIGWTIGFGVLVGAIAFCGAFLWRRFRPDEALATDPEQGLIANVTWRLRGRWLALSVVPSALLLGVTLHIGTDIAAAPFLWVLPLALYLLTFVFVFARREIVSRKWVLRGQALFVTLVVLLYLVPDLSVFVVHVLAMFFSAWALHGELARQRPVASYLTEFYLWMSIGGVVGGFLAGIAAPLVFDGVYEYPIALVLAVLLRPREAGGGGWIQRVLRGPLLPGAQKRLASVADLALDLALPALLWLVLLQEGLRTRLGEGIWAVIQTPKLEALTVENCATLGMKLVALTGLFLLAQRPLRFALGFLVALQVFSPSVLGTPDYRLTRERSFFGVYAVNQIETPVGKYHLLMNGGVNHGGQNMDRPLGPVTYYTREGPFGQFFHVVKTSSRPMKRFAVIGLGVGQAASYLSHGDQLTYFEIDPLDEEIARNPRYFSYLSDAADKVDVLIGDGRRLLEEQEDGTFDFLLVAAFTGDAIPAHLLTKEAFALYFQKLAPDGYLLLNVTNTYLDLMPIVANVIHDAGFAARFSRGVVPHITPLSNVADYVVAARKSESLARFAYTNPPWQVLEPDPDVDLWTDDFTNITQALRWERYGLLGGFMIE